jgi:hypothetical protein
LEEKKMEKNEEKKEEELEVQNPALKLVQRLQENRKSLHIARVPDKTKEAFVNLAEAEFCGDYGMTLKWLMDDILTQDTKVIIAKLEEFEARLQSLESTKQPGSERVESSFKKMLNGDKKLVRGSG